MKTKPEYILGAVLLSITGIGLAFLLAKPSAAGNMFNTGGIARSYAEITNPSGFVNTDSITIGELVGKKVVLIDFLTYSCINCQRTFPYLNAWYKEYKDQGLEIIGIHTPEFAFEKNIKNVREAMQKFGITHPIVLDNEYATWTAWGNRYWPRKYLIDIHGKVVYDHIGEGGYEETEKMIQKLLKERAELLGESSAVMGTLVSGSVEKTLIETRSPETYFGAGRNEYLGNGQRLQPGLQTFTLPETTRSNTLYLGGTWDIAREHAETISTDAIVQYQYSAKEVYIVAESARNSAVEVWQDGKKVSTEAGVDVADGVMQVKESRLYKVIKNEKAGTHTLELRVKGKGVRFFAFTFG